MLSYICDNRISNTTAMKLYQKSFNYKAEAVAFINESGIAKEDILSFFQEKDSSYTVMYYAE